ncbi:thiol-disulfide oxidoreductase DCC family protein [Geojedonia litorea]|uniref:Thiol-disulfide oxidoreductase DCC family protein n=1 Tax=Geojedonia litorea TaxID=1268269 RepID=A0ABV9N454_9FLAO
MINLPKYKQLILFDGVCNLCNASVQYIIKHDKKDAFRFAALQSTIGQQLIKEFKIDQTKTDSILLMSNKMDLSYKSTAALKIASKLGYPRNLMAFFLIVPPFLRNWVYDYIAKNRYKWYGRRDECMIPTPEIQSKFLN